MDDAITKAFVLKATRLVHRYSGIFFAPTILFFAITGGLRMFGLHETSRGSSYLPPEKPGARRNVSHEETDAEASGPGHRRCGGAHGADGLIA